MELILNISLNISYKLRAIAIAIQVIVTVERFLKSNIIKNTNEVVTK